MIRAREDRWFDRFRRTGEARLLARVFDRTAPELWRVAAHLSRDRHVAEDAVQSAFLAAIEARDDWDATRPLLPWLLGLLANRVREIRRQHTRVLEAERLARVVERDPADLAAQHEFGAAFHAALQRVGEPYRTTLERHLVHGLAPRELAVELGVPPGTVRMRLHRGLDLLRRKLPAGFVAGGLAIACLSRESFAQMRQVVLARVPGGAALANGGIGVAGAFAGLWLHKAALATLACVLAVVGVAWFRVSDDPLLGEVSQVPVASLAAELPAAEGRGVRSDVLPDAGQQRSAVAATNSTGTLRVVLRNEGNHQPIRDARVTVLAGAAARVGPRSEAAPAPAPVPIASLPGDHQDGRTDAAGEVVFEVPAGPLRITVEDLIAAPILAEARAGAVDERLVLVPVRIAADVLVVDAAGRPVADALLLGRRNANLGGEHAEIGRTAADGHWRQACIERTLLVRAVVDGLGASPAVLLDDRRRSTTLQLGGAAAVLHGTVLARDGQPVAMAWLAIRSQATPKDPPLVLRADALGRYRCAYVPPGPCAVYAWREAGPGENRFAMAAVAAAANTESQVDVRFGRGASVRATLRRPGGSAWQGVHVTVLPKERLGIGIDVHRRVATDARGEAVIDGLLPGAYDVQVRVENETHSELVELAEGQDHEFTRELGGSCWVEVHAVDVRQQPLVGWIAMLHARGEQVPWVEPIGEARVDAQGLVRFPRLPAQPFVVSLHKVEGGAASVVCDALPNVRTEVVVGPAQMPDAMVRGRVASAAGMPLHELQIGLMRTEVDGRHHVGARDTLKATPDPSGQFTFPGLPAGTWHLGIVQVSGDPQRAGRVVGMRHGIAVAAGAEVDVGTVEIGVTTLRCRILRADGVLVVAPRLLLGVRSVESAMARGVAREDGLVEAQELAPGAYGAVVWGANIAPVAMSIELRAGQELDLPVVAPAAIPTTFRFVGLPPGTNLGQVTVSQGGARLVTELFQEPGGPFVRGLLPGSYRIEFETPFVAEPVRGAVDFTVGGAPGPEVEVRLAK